MRKFITAAAIVGAALVATLAMTGSANASTVHSAGVSSPNPMCWEDVC
jgi:hypothetical protein